MEKEEKIEEIIGRLTDEEKAQILLDFIEKIKNNSYKFPNVLFKDFKPKYKDLEVIYDCDEKDIGKVIPSVARYDKVVKRFGDRRVLSYIDYDETKTTSVRLSKWSNI